MIPIKTLEIRMSSKIRTAIRKSMGFIDVTNLGDPLHGVLRSLESYLYEPLYNQVLETYSEGYTSGGNLIRRHMPAGSMLAAAVLEPLEDSYIAKATKYIIDGVEYTLAGYESEIQAMIKYYIEQGATFSQITSRISRYFGDNNVVAERFARTATNDIYNRAHLARYEDSGVVDGVEYSAHIDRRTSDICRMLDGTIWALGDSGIQMPPSHFNCFIEGTRIEPTSDLVAAFRAWYDGQVVELTLSTGRRLTVTPNHMLLTPCGFLAAKFIHEGDDIISRPSLKRAVHCIHPNDDDIDPTVEEVFSALLMSRGVRSERMPATSTDFHNDGGFIKGDIDIVTPERFLLGARDPPFGKHLDKHVLRPTDLEPGSFAGAGDLASVLFRLAYAADGRMSGIRKTSAFFGSRVAHPDIHSFTTIARDDAQLVETRSDDTTRHTKFFGETFNRPPPLIQPAKSGEVNIFSFGGFEPKLPQPSTHRSCPDPKMIRKLLTIQPRMIEVQEVVNINILPFHGYIYDFQTISTLCIGNGVVTSNCRSRIKPYFGAIPGKRDFKTEFGAEFVTSAIKVSTIFRSKYWSPMAGAT